MKNLTKAIKDEAKAWASKLTKEAKSRAPRHIAPHISTKTTRTESGGILLVLGVKKVDKVQDGTNDAVAWEYGSGIHSPKNPHSYIIRPVNKKMLAFITSNPVVIKRSTQSMNWSKKKKKPMHRIVFDTSYNPKNKAGIDGNSKIVLANEVKHPGVSGKAYMRDSIRMWRKEMRTESTKKFRDSISMDIRDMLKGGVFK